MWICINIYTHTYASTYLHTHTPMPWRISRIYIYIRIYTHTSIYTQTNALANFAYTYSHMYIYTHTYIHTHQCFSESCVLSAGECCVCVAGGSSHELAYLCYMTHLLVCDMTHLHAWHYWFICILARHGSFTCVTWLIHLCDTPHSLVCDMTHSLVCDMTHSLVCDMTHSLVCDMTHSLVCDMTHSFVCDMNHSYVWHEPFICVTWLTYLCDMTCVKDVGCHNGVWKWCVHDVGCQNLK